jgi:23S rRNA G2445 N2-methylase RlmL
MNTYVANTPLDPKAHYRLLRHCTSRELWENHIPEFNQSGPESRPGRVGLIRAVGVVFSSAATAAEKQNAREWLVQLLADPSEKVRRYAILALPKLGTGPKEETALLDLFHSTASTRERDALAETLGKIGSAASLQALRDAPGAPVHAVQKIQAGIVRVEDAGSLNMDQPLEDFRNLRIHLRCRKGLEAMVRDEVAAESPTAQKFQFLQEGKTFVAVRAAAPFSLTELTFSRCAASMGFVLGIIRPGETSFREEVIAHAITSPLARRLFHAFHHGTPRYRIDFIGTEARRGSAIDIASRAYSLDPRILNDAHHAPWAVEVHGTAVGESIELRPRWSPDPRFAYRVGDVAASSHPPLAAALARISLADGGSVADAKIWDPFCGSGLELIERTALGGVGCVHGSDLDAEAIATARANMLEAEKLHLWAKPPRTSLHCGDFRKYPGQAGIGPGSLDLVISNPPLGRRIRVPDLRGLIGDLFQTSGHVLRHGGKLVFTHPLKTGDPTKRFRLHSRHPADLGGYECRLECWIKER